MFDAECVSTSRGCVFDPHHKKCIRLSILMSLCDIVLLHEVSCYSVNPIWSGPVHVAFAAYFSLFQSWVLPRSCRTARLAAGSGSEIERIGIRVAQRAEHDRHSASIEIGCQLASCSLPRKRLLLLPPKR
jgi:hypothetical protein